MKQTTSMAERWLWLGVAALAIAGVFAVVLVAARTPQLAAFTELFSVALVIHVDLSVLVWFLCIGGMGWALLIEKLGRPWPYWQHGAFYTTAAATVLMALSPFGGHLLVWKSNYIPVLDNEWFLLSLALLTAGISVAVIELLVNCASAAVRRRLDYSELGFVYAALATGIAVDAFFFSAWLMPEGFPRQLQFETLFWAGGHILQFAYTALMMAGWVALLREVTGKVETSFAVFIAYALVALAAIASYAGFVLYPFDSPEFIGHQTFVMQWLGGLGAGLLALIIVQRLRVKWVSGTRAYSAALIMSLLLFFGGGLLGVLIEGQNVTIPAHYHGAIVGVTLSLMGLAYVMLPRFGYAGVANDRLAFWQPIIYGIGQLMHISGLAYSGGYGVLRKTPAGETVELAANVKVALGFMGLGGLLAIIGGLLFVLVMGRAYLRRGLRRGNV